jgi:hypothetical protein
VLVITMAATAQKGELAMNENISGKDHISKNEKQLDRFRTETVPDLKQTADSLKNFEIVGMGLGDLVWDAMNLYAPYRQAVSNLGMTM